MSFNLQNTFGGENPGNVLGIRSKSVTKQLIIFVFLVGVWALSFDFFKKSQNLNFSLIKKGTSDTFPHYTGSDLSQRFKEEEVFSLSSLSQVNYYFTDYKNIQALPAGGTLPPAIEFNNNEVILKDKGGIVFNNPAKGLGFYRIEVEIEDNSQRDLVAYLTLIDKFWQEGSVNGVSLGVNAPSYPSTYFYYSTEWVQEENRLCKSSDSEDQRRCTFSRDANRFAKRKSGTVKLIYYVTPMGTYAVVTDNANLAVNFSSLPGHYFGDYIFDPQYQINYIVLGKWNQGGDQIKFKNLKVVKLDAETANNIDEISAFLIKKVVESPDFNNYSSPLWKALFLRGYDYYFGTDHKAEVRSLVNKYISEELPQFKNKLKNEWISKVINSNQVNLNRYNMIFEMRFYQSFPTVIYGISDYLEASQLETIRREFRVIADFLMNEVIKPSGDAFPQSQGFPGASMGEETSWLSCFLGGYLAAFPEDTSRADRIKEYISFLAYTGLSGGKSMREAYGNTLDFNSFKYLDSSYFDFRYKSVEPDSNDPTGTTGLLDQHGFHPNINYGFGSVGQVYNLRMLFEKNGISVPALTYHPTVDKVFQKSVIEYLDFSTLAYNKKVDVLYTDKEDVYQFQDNSVSYFSGRDNPSRLDDWGTTFESYYVFDSAGKYDLTNSLAKTVYFLRYPAGEIARGHDPLTFATYPTQSWSPGYALYYFIHSPRSSFDPRINRPSLTSLEHYFPGVILGNKDKGWVNYSFPEKNQPFTVEFDFVYLGGGTTNDVVVGLSKGPATAYTNLAAILRLLNDKFDARNKDSYTWVNEIVYNREKFYHVRMEINPQRHIYSVYVTDPSGQEKVLAGNFQFRGEQLSTSSLNNLSIIANASTTPGYYGIFDFQLKDGIKTAACDITGPTELLVGQPGTFKVVSYTAPQGSSIHFAPVGADLCQANSWNTIRERQTDGESSYTFSNPGTYWVVCNAGSVVSCSGNPGTSGNKNCGWLDCGPQDSYQVKVNSSVTPTPTPSSGPTPTPVSGCLSAYCNPAGAEQSTNCFLDWADVPEVSRYALRVNDLANGWSGTCSWTYPGDYCLDVSSSRFEFIGKGGHQYTWWWHPINSNGTLGPATGCPVFSAPLSSVTPTPLPSLTISNVSFAERGVVNEAVGRVQVGVKYYLDRTYTITGFTSSLGNRFLIKTYNDDASSTASVYLSFRVNRPVRVYVAYDPRATSIPNWLASFTYRGDLSFKVNDPGINGSMKIYAKDFPAGTVNLGGNRATGGNKTAKSNYVVIVE